MSLSPAPKYATNDGVLDQAQAWFGSALLEGYERVGEVTLVVERARIVDVLQTLRDEGGYQQLMEIAGVDYPSRPERFEVVYHLLSVTQNHRIRVKVTTDEATPVPTVTGLWPVANWLEREVFDMFGVLFDGHPDLRRILTDYGFRGHPLRKDFPLTGFSEVWYSEEQKRVVYEPVKLAQDLRTWDFLSPWEGPEYQLPGDEKAKQPGEKGGMTPASADAVQKGASTPTPPPAMVSDSKVTDSVRQTGTGGPKGDEPELKPGGRAQPAAAGTGKEGMTAVPPETVPAPTKDGTAPEGN